MNTFLLIASIKNVSTATEKSLSKEMYMCTFLDSWSIVLFSYRLKKREMYAVKREKKLDYQQKKINSKIITEFEFKITTNLVILISVINIVINLLRMIFCCCSLLKFFVIHICEHLLSLFLERKIELSLYIFPHKFFLLLFFDSQLILLQVGSLSL